MNINESLQVFAYDNWPLERAFVVRLLLAHNRVIIFSLLCNAMIRNHSIKQRNRAVATVIPYTNNATMNSVKSTSPVLPRKPPLTLQESGIFEEEEEEEDGEKEYEDEDERDVEFASRGTQTEAPSGELLQEVQRLQELRARIQERAAKITTPVFHPTDPSKICFDVSTMDSIVQLTSYQERVRDLEERLEIYEEAETSREREKRLSKQREEELLDENYRLTEKLYWLENELRTVAKCTFDEHDSGDRVVQQMKDVNQYKRQAPEKMQNLEDVQDQCKDSNCTRAVQTIETCGNYMATKCPRRQDKDNSDQQITLGAQCNVTVRNLGIDLISFFFIKLTYRDLNGSILFVTVCDRDKKISLFNLKQVSKLIHCIFYSSYP